MSELSAEQELRRWKQQYYDHLDLLDQKEKEWHALESVLKKTVLRLTIAAEGQHATVDRQLQEIRSFVKERVDVVRLDQILEEMSALLLKLGDRQHADSRAVVALMHLLQELELPDKASRQKKKLLKKLSRATDDVSDELTDEVRGLIAACVHKTANDALQAAKPGWLKKLFGGGAGTDTGKGHEELTQAGNRNGSPGTVTTASNEVAKAVTGTGLDDVSIDIDEGPSIQEILIQLLEQLMVSPDLLEEVEGLKRKIEAKGSELGWKQLLKDIARLINTLRSRLQEEKQEFESFLQQITGRLKEMDSFLAIENASLTEAEQAGEAFEVVVNEQVRDIHQDMTAASDLEDLKQKVERRLNVVSDHIKQYRIKEHKRYADAQQNMQDMQSRLKMLEQESGDLRKVILEKNREAMFDALTGIPNRLSYDKKAAEEIARCKRFSTSLCMAVWDIDHFKRVNDEFGHNIGDKVIKVIAQLLNERIRETDFIARYGGEEFVMFLPGTGVEEALKLADDLREKVAASKFKHFEDVIKITVSCGISRYADGDDQESMFERADQALYQAKRGGRNQCMVES